MGVYAINLHAPLYSSLGTVAAVDQTAAKTLVHHNTGGSEDMKAEPAHFR